MSMLMFSETFNLVVCMCLLDNDVTFIVGSRQKF